MVFVRKFLTFLLLFAALSLPADDGSRSRFLKLYYGGKYEEAHVLLDQAFPDTWVKQVWDERIHQQAEIPACALRAKSTPAARGMALLRIGDFQAAQECFGGDWLSELARATFADWEGRDADSRDAIRRALALSPDNPDLVYFAANIAPNRELAMDFFRQYLELPQDDPYKKAVVEYAMEFMKKTWDIPLNVPQEIHGMESVDSNYKNGRLLIHAVINGKEKVSLLLDTGAGTMTLKERDWQPQLTSDMMMLGIGKKQTSRGTRLVLNRFEAGGYQIKNPVAAMSPGVTLDGVDGIAGTAMFSHNYMLVPLRSGRSFTLFSCDNPDPLTCLETGGIRFSEKTTVPFYSVNRLMILKGRIRSSPETLDIMLDTGAAHCIISAAAAKRYAHVNYQLSREAGSNSGLSGIGGRADNLLVTENVEVDVGGIRKQFNQMTAMNLGESSEALELEIDLILGMDFLKDYTLLIDYRNGLVTFLR